MDRKPWLVVLLAVCWAIRPAVNLAEEVLSPAEIREAEADSPWRSLRFGFDAEQKVLDALWRGGRVWSVSRRPGASLRSSTGHPVVGRS